jgi:hypothetical protein
VLTVVAKKKYRKVVPFFVYGAAWTEQMIVLLDL